MVVAVGLTVTELPVCPVDQMMVPVLQPVAVRVTFSGLQRLLVEAAITGGVAVQVPQSVLMLMIMAAEAGLVPQAVVQVAV